MGIERTVADSKGKGFGELPNETNTKTKSKKSRRRQKKMPPPPPPPPTVQKLFNTCKEVFASGRPGHIPPPQDIEKLKSVLDAMKPEDVGVNPEMPFFRSSQGRRLQRITYLHIFECEKFSMGIFCLPPSGVIPLHNHPEMTVFSKLLFGTMHIKSYDWVTDLPADIPTSIKPSSETAFQPEVRLARVKADADFTAPCNPSILYPADGGNMHCFTAVNACAVLDVLGPPYSDPDGRHCQYYHDYPFSKFSVEGSSIPEEERKGYAWLQEREKPEDLEVIGRMYSP
ncbi:hypothetical protein L6164_008417 [Bauhinia variegata]|uniref:Uncharacterized protein n=1 Tax=Bauhinia variegata TaxID=167791 RepID=A0ACB9PI49_BAUVA|nr:hypothetical protein L6164_008417 [Bauhinia variegata]